MTDLYAAGPALAEVIDTVAARLGTIERRVAASTFFLGYVGQLWSIALGTLAGGVLPDLSPARMRWGYDPGAPVALRLTRLAGRRPAATDHRRLLAEAVLQTHVAPLVSALHEDSRVAAGLLWGNAAAALVGAARVLTARTGARGPRRLAAALLDSGPLAGTTVHLVDPDGGLDLNAVLRRSCCLYYRVPGGGVCGDCPLAGRAVVSPAGAGHGARRTG